MADEILIPAMWHDHDIDFARWLHLHVTRGSGMTCYWICQVAAPCNVAGGSGITCHCIRPNVRHIWILLLVSISAISPQSTCHSAPVCAIWSKSDHPQQKKMTSCRICAILDFRGPIMGSLKNPCTTSYRSSIETVALNCLVIFVFWWQTDKQTNRQTNRWTGPLHEAALAVASGGLITG